MKTNRDFFFFVSTLLIFISACSNGKTNNTDKMKKVLTEEEKYRPNFHFTPQKNWMNDPNGMFFLNEVFHLYFQYHPDSNVWGPMHWGHATSKDLINWTEHPIALYPDKLGTIFSGSAVVDFENTSGLGTLENPPIIAIYTNHDTEEEKKGGTLFQTQSIAYSLDKGYSWDKYENNPVIENPGIRDFRDPKVFWMESQQKWIMTLAAGQETQFYASFDGVWECPDLFPLKVNGSDTIKWVLLVSINPGGPNGGSATQYFIGDFDGTRFTIDTKFKTELETNHSFWIDFGKDNYAGVTFSNFETDKKSALLLGWMSNWEYAKKVPTFNWRSSMTLPRILELNETESSYRLQSKLSVNWDLFSSKKIRTKERSIEEGITIVAANAINLSSARAKVKLKNLEPTTYTFVLSNHSGDSLLFGYNHKERQFFIDRSKSGKVSFSDDFSKNQSLAPRFYDKKELEVEFVLDKTSVEVFFDDGETVMTEIFFPDQPFQTLSLLPKTSSKTIFSAELFELEPKKNIFKAIENED
jgi:levanase/fructan beta-fructosidase